MYTLNMKVLALFFSNSALKIMGTVHYYSLKITDLSNKKWHQHVAQQIFCDVTRGDTRDGRGGIRRVL